MRTLYVIAFTGTALVTGLHIMSGEYDLARAWALITLFVLFDWEKSKKISQLKEENIHLTIQNIHNEQLITTILKED